MWEKLSSDPTDPTDGIADSEKWKGASVEPQNRTGTRRKRSSGRGVSGRNGNGWSPGTDW